MNSVLALARAGFIDFVRGKVFAIVVAAGAALICGALLAQELAGSEGNRVLADLGLAFISLAVDVLSGVLSVVTVAHEIETRQAHLLLARPISRLAYVAGRFLSVAGVIVITNVILGLLLAGLLVFEGSPEWAPTVFGAALFCSFEAFIVAALAILLGVGSSTAISALYLILLVVLGRLVVDLEAVIVAKLDGTLESVCLVLTRGLPALDRFDLTPAIHGAAMTSTALAQTGAYGLLYTAAALALAGLRLQRRDLQ